MWRSSIGQLLASLSYLFKLNLKILPEFLNLDNFFHDA